MSTSYTFSVSGSLTSGTRFYVYTLPTDAQTVLFDVSTSQTLGAYPLGALGTDLTISANSNYGDGFDVSGYRPQNIIDFATYPHVESGNTGLCPVAQFLDDNAVPPDIGSTPFNIDTGTPPANTVIPFSTTGTMTGQSESGGVVTGLISSNAEGNYCEWDGTQWPTSTNINAVHCIVVQNDEGIPISFSITGTAYVNSGGGDTGEVIILDNVSPTYNTAIPLAGNNYGPLATAMQVSQDGAAWSTVAGFDSGVAWSGSGALGEYGTHTLQVRDTNTLVQSNVVTYTLSLPANTTFLGLFQSDVIPTAESEYIEFGAAMAWTYETSLFPDNKELLANSAIVTALDVSFIGAQPTINCYFYDASGATELGAATVRPTGKNTIWDRFVWGEAPWGGTSQYYARALVNWSAPLAFVQGYFEASGASAEGFSIGALYMQMQTMGYVQQLASGVT